MGLPFPFAYLVTLFLLKRIRSHVLRFSTRANSLKHAFINQALKGRFDRRAFQSWACLQSITFGERANRTLGVVQDDIVGSASRSRCLNHRNALFQVSIA